MVILVRADELRKMTEVELAEKLKEFKEELFNLGFNMQLPN